MQKNPPRVFDYTDFRAFLAEFYRLEKERNPKFSHRFIQEKVGAASAGWFADLVKARINLTGTFLLRLLTLLDLNRSESQYFESLVQYDQASSFEDKTRWMERLRSFKEIKADLVGQDKFEYYSKWYYAAIRELLFLHDFRGDYRVLAQALNPAIRPKQAREAIALLERLEFIRTDEAGRYRPSAPILKKDTAFKSLHLTAFLRANMQLGMEALDRFDRDDRDISSLALVLSEESFRNAKEEIKALRKKLLAWSEKPKAGGKVYQCNFQVFPVSK